MFETFSTFSPQTFIVAATGTTEKQNRPLIQMLRIIKISKNN